MTADDDYKLLQNGIGFTNMVERATKGSADLTRKEIKEGLFLLIDPMCFINYVNEEVVCCTNNYFCIIDCV